MLVMLVMAGCGHGQDATVPPDAAPKIEAAATPASPSLATSATTRAVDPALAADLAIMRAHDQHTWTPAAGPAMAAATRVFAAIHFEGMTTAEVEGLIGPPMSRDPGDAVWHYAYHNGEMGVVRWFHIADGRVVSVQTVMTQ